MDSTSPTINGKPRDFDEDLEKGKEGEGIMRIWLLQNHFAMRENPPVPKESWSGPKIAWKQNYYNAPDVLVGKEKKAFWYDSKLRERFTYYGITKTFNLGVSANYINDYVRLEELFGIPVILFFITTSVVTDPVEVAKFGAPARCPVGMFTCPASLETKRFENSKSIYFYPFSAMTRVGE